MGDYLKLFETHTEYETYIGGQDVLLPNVSYCEDNNEVHYNPIPLPSKTLANGQYKFDLTSGAGQFFACMDVLNGNVKVYAASTSEGSNMNVYNSEGAFIAANGGETILTAVSSIAETYDNFTTIERMEKASGNLSNWDEYVEITAAE